MPARTTRLIAIIAGIAGLLLCVLTPLLPVRQTTATILWPQNIGSDGLVTNVTNAHDPATAGVFSLLGVRMEVAPESDHQGRLVWLKERLAALSPRVTRLALHPFDSVAVAAVQPGLVQLFVAGSYASNARKAPRYCGVCTSPPAT